MESSASDSEMLIVPIREPAQAILLTPVKYESMDVWMQEQIERNAITVENPSQTPKKQRKRNTSFNSEAAAFEGKALEALGTENWIGLLQRYADAHPHHQVDYEEIVVDETTVPRFKYFVTIRGFSERFGSDPRNEPSHATFSNKKKAKNYAAQKAVEWLISNKHMPGNGTVKFPEVKPPLPDLTLEQNALQLLGDKNWIGRLQEYLVTRRKNPPIYTEITTGGGVPRFRYTLRIDGAENPFGEAGRESQGFVTFSSKKSAKQYVAKQAMDWLTGREDSAPAVASPQPVPIVQQQAVQPTDPVFSRSESPPYTTRVPDLSTRLGLSPPSYVLTPAADVANCPLWDGYADFSGHPRIGEEGKVGHVRSVHGKKNAKEAIAKQVFDFLKEIEKHRLSFYEEEDRKRKRSSNGPQE